MEPGQRNEIPLAMYQLAEQYRLGRPLAVHTMRPQWLRLWQVFRQALLVIVIITVFLTLVNIALFMYQLFTGQITDVQLRLISGLGYTILGLISCVGWLSMRHIIARQIPASILVCTEGLLEISPKGIDMTRWDEVKKSLQGPGFEKTKRYKLHRINRKPFLFSEVFENVEGLADLVRQYTQKAER